jgi:hypothetical protein
MLTWHDTNVLPMWTITQYNENRQRHLTWVWPWYVFPLPFLMCFWANSFSSLFPLSRASRGNTNAHLCFSLRSTGGSQGKTSTLQPSWLHNKSIFCKDQRSFKVGNYVGRGKCIYLLFCQFGLLSLRKKKPHSEEPLQKTSVQKRVSFSSALNSHFAFALVAAYMCLCMCVCVCVCVCVYTYVCFLKKYIHIYFFSLSLYIYL